MHKVCPEGTEPCTMKNRDIYWRRYKIQETLYTGQWHLSPLQSRHLGTSHNSPDHYQLPHLFFLNLTNGLRSLPFQRWFQFLEKPESQGIKSGLQGDWVTWVIWCFTKKLCMKLSHKPCPNEAAKHQLPIAVAFWIIQIVSVEECSSLVQNLMHIHCSTCSVILNAMATQYTCSFNGIYRLHWLVQWSHHCSQVHIPQNYFDIHLSNCLCR